MGIKKQYLEQILDNNQILKTYLKLKVYPLVGLPYVMSGCILSNLKNNF